MSEPASAVIDRQIAAYNRQDLAGFLACYAPDVTVEDGSGAVRARGLEGVRDRYGPLFEQHPELRAEIVSRIAVGDYVVDEERIRGGPSGEVHGLTVYRVADGLIAQVRLLK